MVALAAAALIQDTSQVNGFGNYSTPGAMRKSIAFPKLKATSENSCLKESLCNVIRCRNLLGLSG